MKAPQNKKNSPLSKEHLVKADTPRPIGKNDWLPALLLFLYSLVEFIPAGASGEVMGSQWLYLNIVNIISLICLYVSGQDQHKGRTFFLLRNSAVICYLLFLVLAGLSWVFAMNKTEMLVSYARLIVTGVMLINLFLLFSGRPHLLKPVAILLSLYGLIQAVQVLTIFFDKLDDTDISKLILGLTGNAGNKNILSVSLVLKMPFIFYCLYSSRFFTRTIFSIVLSVVAFAVFIINARSAYLGLLLATGAFIMAVLIHGSREKKIKEGLYTVIFIAVPLLLALFLSQATIKKAIADQGTTTAYGTVFERLNTVSFTAKGSSSRVQMWSSATDYVKKHPVIGCGYGNWKLASIPYEKTYVDEVRITKHAHNDFLEMTAELGIPGGLLYLLVFLSLAVQLLRLFFSRENEQQRTTAAVLLAALGIYFTDAFLNFPMERPVTQFFYALIFALSLGTCFSVKQKEKGAAKAPGYKWGKFLIPALLLVSLGTAYLTYANYRSLKAQTKVNDDMQLPAPVTRWEDIRDIFPAVPNLNSYGFPISHIKAFYLMLDKKYDSALALINRNTKVNPHLTLTEYLKAKIFLETNQSDSAYYYASKAFYEKPRALSHYEILNTICLARKDSTGIENAFREFTRYRNEPTAWNSYIELRSALRPSDPGILQLVDSALVLFPADEKLLQKKSALQAGLPAAIIPGSAEDEYQKAFARGFELFNQQQYRNAIPFFTKAASLKPGEYLPLENIGLCYYSLLDYQNAIPYFNKVIQQFDPGDGKSDFLVAISLLNLRDNNQGCLYLKRAVAKGFPQAAAQAAIYCK